MYLVLIICVACDAVCKGVSSLGVCIVSSVLMYMLFLLLQWGTDCDKFFSYKCKCLVPDNCYCFVNKGPAIC